MSTQSRLERIERATGINEPCPACALSTSLPADLSPQDYVSGICDLCGAPTKFLVRGWTAREKEAAAVYARAHIDGLFSDRRTMAIAFWLERRIKERGQTHAQEYERLKLRVTFDPTARSRVALIEKYEIQVKARDDAFLATASDETLRALVEIGNLTDEELEAIIWPESVAAPARHETITQGK